MAVSEYASSARGMCVAVEREKAACVDGTLRELVVDVLPRWIAVDLDGHVRLPGRREDLVPVRRDARARSVLPPARVAENVHARRSDRR